MTTTDLVSRPAVLDTVTTTEPDAVSTLFPLLMAAVHDLLDGGSGDIFTVLAKAFGHMDWAEEEIEAARARHPRHADRLWHSFSLLVPQAGLERMASEFVYRSHCRELLDRVAAGEDTRPGTAAEVCCAMRNTSLLAPFTSAAAGLYMRMWQAARFPDFPGFAEASRHHEALERSLIDDHEQFARRRLAVPDRRLGTIDCHGRHHGEDVDCAYAPVGHLAIDL